MLGLSEIWAEALDTNPRSIRILQRLGMTETGRGDPPSYRRFVLAADGWHPAVR